MGHGVTVLGEQCRLQAPRPVQQRFACRVGIEGRPAEEKQRTDLAEVVKVLLYAGAAFCFCALRSRLTSH